MEPSPFASSLDSGGECGVVTNTIFPESVTWRALTHGNVHVLMLNSELSVAAGSPQWNFTRDALAAVDRAVTPWSLVFFHRPLYFVSASKSGSGSAGVRDADFAPLEPLFVEYGVDMVAVGHVHNTFVSCPVNNSVCGAGLPVHICIGNAGQGITPIQDNNVPAWVLFQKAVYGYATLEANATHMQVRLFDDASNSLLYAANFTR